MKLKLFGTLLASTALFFACDKVDFPNQTGTTTTTGGDTDVVVQKILIEDFTGQGCGNCPGAAVIAKQLQDLYGDQVIVVGVHAGWFANGGNPWSGASNFTCTESEELNTTFGNDIAGNPNGFVNRTEVSSNIIVSPANWGTTVQDIIDNSTPRADVNINASLSGGTITAEIDIEYLEDLTGDYSLVVAVTEDNITDWQKNYANTGDPNYPVGDVSNYVHKHVLRGHMNGTWGTSVITGSASAGGTHSESFNMNTDGAWQTDELSVVAYLYNTATNEIVQVEEVHVQ